MRTGPSIYPFSAVLDIPLSHTTIESALTSVGDIPLWNPAISRAQRVPQARVGDDYRIWIKGFIPGTLRYTTIADGLITYEMKALGNQETGRWEMAPGEPGAQTVMHAFKQSGWLIEKMHSAFEPVALWRLQRLRTSLARGRWA